MMIVYEIVNLVNGKRYIGQTTKTFNERYNFKGEGIERVLGYLEFRENKTDFYNDKLYYNDHLLKAIRKHGTENFKVEILDTAKTIEELNTKEMYWINYFKSNIDGYNHCDGGDNNKGWKMSSATRKHLSKIRKGKMTGSNNPNYGKKHSKSVRKKMSANRKGKMVGASHPKARAVINLDTLEVFETLTSACKSVGIETGNLTAVCQRREMGIHGVRTLAGGYRWMYYDEYLEKGDVVGEYKNNRHKAVKNIDTGKVFETIKAASDYYGIDNSSISKVCRGKVKTTGGYRWEYYIKE